MELTTAEINFLHIALNTLKQNEDADKEKFSLEELANSPFIDTIISKCKEELLLFNKGKTV